MFLISWLKTLIFSSNVFIGFMILMLSQKKDVLILKALLYT